MNPIGPISPIFFSSLGPRPSALSTKRISTWTISLIFFMIFLAFAVPAKASLPRGIDTLQVSTGFLASKQTSPPFWAWANQNGRIPTQSSALGPQHSALSTFFTRFRVNKHSEDEKVFDWFYGVDVTARTNSSENLFWADAYTGLTYKQFKLTLGRKAETFGLVDSLLSAGSECYSQNAPTIPKIALSTNGYIEITDNLAINAYLAHGWMGSEQYVKKAYLHEKFFYLRLGGTDPDNGINFFAGVHDIASWGGVGLPSGFKDFLNVFAGKGGTTGSIYDQQNALGDHRGTIEFALQQKDIDRDWYIYAQTMFEDGSGLRFWYPGDFLLGVSMINKDKHSPIARINLEILDTRFDGNSHTGDLDNYFSNFEYSGWVHEGYAIGTPFVPFIQTANYWYDPQNRVQVINAGIMLRVTKLFNPRVRVACIQNFGSFSAPLPETEATTILACDITNTTPISKTWTLTQQIALDAGKTIHPNPAIGLTITKTID